MNLDRYLEVRKAVLDYAKEVEDKKRMSYTAGAEDVLFNFKSDAEFVGTNPLQNAFTHLLKQFRGISSFVKHPDVEPSEPLISRAADLVNYACLMVAVALDEGREVGHMHAGALIIEEGSVTDVQEFMDQWKKAMVPPPRNSQYVPLHKDEILLATGRHDYTFGRSGD